MLWLAVHFPNLALEVFTRQHFEHQTSQTPIVVLDNNRVCMCNPVAAGQGIVPGTTLATAHSICPTLLHQQKDPQVESRRLETLAGALYRFSSCTCIQAPDCILLEIGGSLRLFGDHEALSQEVNQLCLNLGHTCTVRVAQTPWAAIALARAKETRLTEVPLAQAGLEMAEVPHTVIERFDNMGIYTLGPLLDLPSKQLGKRFGLQLLTYISQLTGALPDPRTAIHPVPEFDQTLHFLQPITDKNTLYDGPMHKLAHELHPWLISHQLGCTELQWTFIHQQSVTMTLRFADGRQNPQDMLNLSQLRLAQIDLPEEVQGICLQVTQSKAWRNASQPLFQLHTRQANHIQGNDVHSLVDEINARLGDNACTGIACLDQHTPEHAWCAYSGSTNAPPSSEKPVQNRPLWLFDRPHSIRRAELELLQGPERIQSNWWQRSTCRDYYIARHQRGAECWAFVDAEDNWYLHGYFS
ncbi:MAG: protein ImuB [Candidatus Azotimanducaceae bacterium]|jgi:protein ImuB